MPLRNLTITTMFLLPMQDFKGPSFPKSSCVSDVKVVFQKSCNMVITVEGN